jgi:DNA recombination protein RmuC
MDLSPEQETVWSERVRRLELDLERSTQSLDQRNTQWMEASSQSAAEKSKAEQLASQLERDRALSMNEIAQLKEQLLRLQAESENLRVQNQTLAVEKSLLAQQASEQSKLIEQLPQKSRLEFENLANQILELKGKVFEENSLKNLEGMFQPLRERITHFEKLVEDKYGAESRERYVLKSEIERLIALNENITRETSSLTKALKGDSKVQGDWGEMVLARILESSGLRAGEEYVEQESRESDEGDRYRPDVVINLPEGKHIVIDSKVSLRAYDRYYHAEAAEDRASYLKGHVKDLENHVNDLSEKHYAKLKGLKTPEFVFMFVPVEPAYLAAMQDDPDFAIRSWKKGVAIVTATTLFTSLKTVAHIWKLEKQNRNAQQIAEEGGRLYDKFVGFVEDFEKIGQTFENGQKQYQTAMGKLREGPGNVFRKVERLRELGAAPNKALRPDLIE